MNDDERCVAVVVTYNKLKLLKECLANLLACKSYLYKIVIVNNASTDGTNLYLTELASKNSLVDVVNEETNLGGASGFNHGIKRAMALKASTIWVMDDDCMVKQRTISSLFDAKNFLVSQGITWGVLASNIRWTDGSAALMNIPKVKRIWNDSPASNLVGIEHSSFVSMFINALTVKKVGYPISDFFIWGDDAEYSMRIARTFPSYCVTDSFATHKMVNNRTADILTDSEDRLSRYFYDIRNNLYISKKTGFKEVLKSIYGLTKKIFLVLFFGGNRLKKIGIMLKGFFAGVFFHPKIEKYHES
ncbi:glycosyltransferase [Lacticaseibacillus rhamnosus]|nr:glycosyltransferase [Lacticaseibacillus rhamnosus]MDM7524971.1 glycosyltransferase [Lacticaseibacillus rhamnosus]